MNNDEEKQNVPDRPSTVQDIVLWIGIDWADEKHCLVTCRPDGSGSQLHWVEQKPERLEEFFLDLRRKHPTGRIGVVLEQSRGALLYALLKYSSCAPGAATLLKVGLGMYSLIWFLTVIFVRPFTST